MNFKEYGDNNKDTIMLLHGGGLSWWNYREEAEKLQESYHIVIPILDGHSDSDRGFTSIEDNAQEIIDYITNNYNVTLTPEQQKQLDKIINKMYN